MLGQTVSHYRILAKLGEGGMGVVYKAEDSKLKRTVALKFLPPELTREPEAKARFAREAQAAAALSHPNIGTVYEIDEAEGRLFIAMECIEGRSLKQKIAAGPLKLDEALDLGAQIAAGLQEAHEKGIVHRDVKPSNIMITAKGVPKILDFGLAVTRERTRMTRTGTTLGTVAYMSPEQARGEDVDRRSDIWSLGIVLYEMLSGATPFSGRHEQAVLYAILNENHAPLTGLRTGLPVELEQIVDKCLVKDPDLRYQHVDELVVDLRRLRQRSLEATGRMPHARRPGGRPRRGLVVTVSALAVLALMVVAWQFVGGRGGRPGRTGGGDGSRAGAEMRGEQEPPGVSSIAAESWRNSLAVLPFRDLSQAGDQQYFCDGMTDALNARLAHIPALKVIATTSVMRFRGTERDIKEIGAELGVANIVEGTVQREGDRIRLSAQLINAENGFHLWSDVFDERVESVFDVQDRISESIAQALALQFSPAAGQAPASERPANLEAYEHYMRGMYFIKSKYVISFQEEDYTAGVSMFERAIEIDPQYAPAYFGLAWAYEHHYQVTGDPEYARLMQEATAKSLELDPNSAIASATMGYARYEYHKDFEGAFRYLHRALELNANIGEVAFLAGTCYLYLGLYEQARELLSKAAALDPYYLWTPYKQAVCAENLGKYDEAARYFEKYFELAPVVLMFPARYIALKIKMGDFDRVEALIGEIEKTRPDYGRLPYVKALLLAARGKKEEALALHKNSEIYALLGMNDEAFAALATEIRGTTAIPYCFYDDLLNGPLYENLHGDPRFPGLVEREAEVYRECVRKYGG
jgi:TolB-like protein/Tfp pilus assembly protein PilF/predicted Ser/Thr protein kinase